MFERLQKKWNVSGFRLAIIIGIFAIGGSLTGYAGRKLLNLLALEKGPLWILLYILLVTLLWPIAVLLVSIPLGQFRFFNNYIRRIGGKLGIGRRQLIESNARLHKAPGTEVRRIAIFASGAGSNAQKIIDHFRQQPRVKVSMVICNKPGAGVLAIADREHIPSLLIEKERFFRGDAYVPELAKNKIDFIVLAGFLWKIPSALIQSFAGRIINIHPALLPRYGGKGMYGQHVHEAVIANGDTESGITIHYVDEIYDHGQIIFQAQCPVLPGDTAADLARRIHQLEHQHYPRVIEELLIK